MPFCVVPARHLSEILHLAQLRKFLQAKTSLISTIALCPRADLKAVDACALDRSEKSHLEPGIVSFHLVQQLFDSLSVAVAVIGAELGQGSDA